MIDTSWHSSLQCHPLAFTPCNLLDLVNGPNQIQHKRWTISSEIRLKRQSFVLLEISLWFTLHAYSDEISCHTVSWSTQWPSQELPLINNLWETETLKPIIYKWTNPANSHLVSLEDFSLVETSDETSDCIITNEWSKGPR